jgi:hypothetical protein
VEGTDTISRSRVRSLLDDPMRILATLPAVEAPVLAAPEAESTTFRREGDFWTAAFEGHVARIRDAKGMGYIGRLLESADRELHVFDLAEHVKESVDAGPMLDARAKGPYRARIAELREGLHEAERWSDVDRAERMREEIDAITAGLSSAVGLGGRDRALGSAVERTRNTV